MRTMIVNNIGTTLYTIFFGKKVGKDSFGNTYYISKTNNEKKWVLYKETIDPTNIPIEWQGWLTSHKDEITFKSNEETIKKYSWEKNRKKNLTGTYGAYHPSKELTELGTVKKQKKYKNWEPNK